ncbi:MAG TPA: ABC transporter ATP-binding protein [Bauldia sp.]|nr:ABC transporter ATP-binding protein [Bauldia sp.]
MSLLSVRAVSKSFGRTPAVDGVTFDLASGGRMAIVGPSGCGKTTLLRLIAGFERPDAGTIALDGRMLAGDASFVPAHRRGIGYLPQDGALFPHLTVEGNIGFGLTTAGDERARRIGALAELVSIDRAMLRRWPHELSGGQQQRVALARALALQPRLILLDEPFSALDANLRVATRKAVAGVLDAANITTILVTHDQAEALSFADQLAVMRDGRFVQEGKPADLFLRPTDAFTARFLGDAVILPAELDAGWAECVLGRVAIDEDRRRGTGRIMFRPEQLSLVAASAEAKDPGCGGRVESIEYTGHDCMVTVRIGDRMEGDPAAGDRAAGDRVGGDDLIVRCSSHELPALKARVRVTASGTAHVLGE